MVELSTKDFKEILDINSELLACRTRAELGMTAMASLRRVLNADTSVFFNVTGSEGNPGIDHGLAFGADDTDLSNYHNHYMYQDPFLSWALDVKHAHSVPVMVSNRLVHYRSFERTEFYNDFFRPISVHSVLGITLHLDAKSIGLLALHRPRNARRFNRCDQAKALLAVPGLLAALQRVTTLEKINERDLILDKLALELPCEGVVVLDSEMSPVFCDARARELLKVMPGKHLTTAEIPEVVGEACRKLMRKTDQSNSSPAPRIALDLQGKSQLGARIRVINAGGSSVRFIVYLEKKHKSLVCDRKLKMLGLTRRETDIVQLVCLGQTSCQIAENLCISERTVENHLRSIYKKSGVHNRSRLIYRLIADS